MSTARQIWEAVRSYILGALQTLRDGTLGVGRDDRLVWRHGQ
jgi:hypothetical protein